jgi:hypothetical protein
MSTSVAVVISVAIIAVVILVALFLKGHVRAAGSFLRASFELEADDPEKPRLMPRRPKL